MKKGSPQRSKKQQPQEDVASTSTPKDNIISLADAVNRRRNSSTGHYILDGHTPVPVDTFTISGLLRWGQMLEHESRVVKQEYVGPFFISTVFLGIDHGWGFQEKPILFESMVFGAKNEYMLRYPTWDEAEEGHRIIAGNVRLDYDFQEEMMLWFGYPFRRRNSII